MLSVSLVSSRRFQRFVSDVIPYNLERIGYGIFVLL